MKGYVDFGICFYYDNAKRNGKERGRGRVDEKTIDHDLIIVENG